MTGYSKWSEDFTSKYKTTSTVKKLKDEMDRMMDQKKMQKEMDKIMSGVIKGKYKRRLNK